jgi:hypothetical protein
MEVQDVIEQHVDVRENEVTHLQFPINLIVLVVEMVSFHFISFLSFLIDSITQLLSFCHFFISHHTLMIVVVVFFVLFIIEMK